MALKRGLVSRKDKWFQCVRSHQALLNIQRKSEGEVYGPLSYSCKPGAKCFDREGGRICKPGSWVSVSMLLIEGRVYTFWNFHTCQSWGWFIFSLKSQEINLVCWSKLRVMWYLLGMKKPKWWKEMKTLISPNFCAQLFTPICLDLSTHSRFLFQIQWIW